MLRGELAELSLPAVLVMLEQERKTGRIELRGDYAAWIELANGAIVGAGTSAADPNADMGSIVMALLDWQRGDFELLATPVRASLTAMPITYVLMEHARRCDELRAHCAIA